MITIKYQSMNVVSWHFKRMSQKSVPVDIGLPEGPLNTGTKHVLWQLRLVERPVPSFQNDNFQMAVIFKTEICYQAETAPANTRSPVAEMKAAVHKAAKRLYLFFLNVIFQYFAALKKFIANFFCIYTRHERDFTTGE